MSNKEISARELINAQNRATQKAKKLIRVLGLEDIVVRNNKVIQISPNGEEATIKESQYKSKKVSKGTFTLKK
ncbi:hypothetical protein SAMN04489724_0650 [Algoriphagus locisalis]|uniref:Uncharacterized protein n=1 Tax=Algoriphagus locisalis TaxID=305507 RepID=A0A1I6XSU7_9BACT|nr:hypothetical protein [Algoriphagus locisalis]SFT41390.1 hypothetical protein SAMN04489724_0650 [Algoriphagus locisalis]